MTRAPGRAIIGCGGRLTLEHGAERLGDIGSGEIVAGRDLIVDVEDVTELDASGLGALARLYHCALARGRIVVVIRPGVRIHQLLQVAFGSHGAPHAHSSAPPVAAPPACLPYPVGSAPPARVTAEV